MRERIEAFDWRGAIARPLTSLYLRFLSLVLLYGASVHVANIVGWGDLSWLETPLLWRVMDILLLGFDVAVAIGLWQRRLWAAIAFPCGLVVLQLIPYTVWRSQFVQSAADAKVLNSLLGSEVVLIAVLMLLLGFKR